MPKIPNDIGPVNKVRSDTAKRLQRDEHGRFFAKAKEDKQEAPKNQEPPLVKLEVTNPISYIKIWWKKVMSSEGVDLRFRIHPITAILISIAIASIGFGLGRISIPSYIPFAKYLLTPTPIPKIAPAPNQWRETAFTGILRFSETTQKHYLFTASSEAISLDVPKNINLGKHIGKRILAFGQFNELSRTLKVLDVSDLEILPNYAITIPTIPPTPTPTPTITPTLTPTSTPTPTSIPTPTPSEQ